jgi:hypothetical protein
MLDDATWQVCSAERLLLLWQQQHVQLLLLLLLLALAAARLARGEQHFGLQLALLKACMAAPVCRQYKQQQQ